MATNTSTLECFNIFILEIPTPLGRLSYEMGVNTVPVLYHHHHRFYNWSTVLAFSNASLLIIVYFLNKPDFIIRMSEFWLTIPILKVVQLMKWS